MEYNVFDLVKQRTPFLFLDKVYEIIPGKSGKAIKIISTDEPYLSGHFPGFPIMPGVLMIEASAQLCSAVMAASEESIDEDVIPMLVKVEYMKFIQTIFPDSKLDIEATRLNQSNTLAKFKVTINENQKKVATGELSFSFAKKSELMK